MLLTLLWTAAGSASAAGEEAVRLQLAADTVDPVAGGGGYLGVLIRPQPGWMVAWKYGGDLGEGTHIRFEVGPGLVTGDPLWPLPEVVRRDDGELGYGYRGPFVVAVPVVPLKAPESVETIRVRVVVEYTACRNECMHERRVLEGAFPMTRAIVREAAPAFAHWRRSLPPPEDDLESVPPFLVERSGGIARGQGWGAMSVWLHWPRNPGRVQWIPDPDPGVEVRDVRVSGRGKTTRIDLTVEAASLEGGVSLRSLVVANSPRGRIAYRLWLPVAVKGPARPRSSR